MSTILGTPDMRTVLAAQTRRPTFPPVEVKAALWDTQGKRQVTGREVAHGTDNWDSREAGQNACDLGLRARSTQ